MKYIIDTDPGIDDAIGIIFGYLNNLDIIGFTIATGNIEEEKSMNNINTIQNVLKTNIKMYTGSVKNKSNATAEFAHGIDGLGNIFYPKLDAKFEETTAEDFIIEASKKYKDDLTIICLAPLTNIASAIKKDPELPKRISKIYIMGTSYNPNEEIPYNEFNVRTDVDSAKIVFTSSFNEMRIITHEIGIKSYVERNYINSLKDSKKETSQFIYKIAQKYMEFSFNRYNIDGLTMPDPTTIMSIINEETLEFKPCKLVLKDGLTYITQVEQSNIYVSTNLNLEKIQKIFKETIN